MVVMRRCGWLCFMGTHSHNTIASVPSHVPLTLSNMFLLPRRCQQRSVRSIPIQEARQSRLNFLLGCVGPATQRRTMGYGHAAQKLDEHAALDRVPIVFDRGEAEVCVGLSADVAAAQPFMATAAA